MEYRQIPPVPALQPYIKFFWLLEGAMQSNEPERVFPDGCMELIFNLKNPLSRIDNNQAIKQPASFLFGQITKALFLAPAGYYSVVAVRFAPFGLSAFTHIPAHEFKGIEVGLEHLWGTEGKILEEKVNTMGTAEAIAAIQSFLIARLKYSHSLQAIGAITTLIENAGSPYSVQHLAQYANLSERQFNRRFNDIVGISPKEYIKISRFNKVLQLVSEENPARFGALAQQCGYYDQAHFIKDFREYTGTTPGGFAQDTKMLLPI